MAYEWIVPAVSGAASLIGGVGKGKKARHEQWITNQANNEFTREQNESNRQWSEDMWDKTNAYNSPAQVMARFKDAGLNPHLIYGQQPQASQPMAASTQAQHNDVMPVDNGWQEAGRAIMEAGQQYVANKLQQSQIDNMAKTREVMDAEIRAKDASVAESVTRNARSKYDLELAQELRSNVVQDAIYNTQTKGLEVQKVEQEIRNAKASEGLTNAQIEKAAQDIIASRAQVEMLHKQGRNADAEYELKQLDIKLKKLGIQPSDNMMWRVPAQVLSDPDMRGKVGNALRNWWSK